jgi:hypothetical protein
MGSVPSVTHWVVAVGGADTRETGVDRRDRVQTRPASTPASLRKNGLPKTPGPKFVVAWKQLLLGVPAGHVPHCHGVVAHVVATGERGDRSGGRSARRRKTHPLTPREAESRSSLPRRASGRGSPQPNWSGGAETLEQVLHSAERPKILDSCSYPRPIVVNFQGSLSFEIRKVI